MKRRHTPEPLAVAARPRRLVGWTWVTVEVGVSPRHRAGRDRLARFAERLGAERDLLPILPATPVRHACQRC